MERIHSIKNPDSFSDCISMLFSFAMQEDVEWNFDIMSGRCFRMQYETDIKKWILFQTVFQCYFLLQCKKM